MLLICRLAAAGLSLALASGSLVAGSADDDTPIVVATTSIWADIVDRIDCGDHFTVETLIPVGGDAHSFEPSIRDRQRLGDASLVVANGGGLEELLHDTLDAVAGEGVTVLEVFDHVTTAPLDHADEDEHTEDSLEGDEHAEDSDEHEHSGDDPHVWFDPTLVVEAAPAVGAELVAAGADAATTDRCVVEFTSEMEALDAELTEILSVVPSERRLLVTNHDALGYFARRYNFEILGSVIPGSSTLAEASPAELEQLADDIEVPGCRRSLPRRWRPRTRRPPSPIASTSRW